MISKLLKKNEKGFTLMEMLIVVAIIAVLIAIAIPTFNASLNKARVATDKANIRSGYASVMADVLTNKYETNEGTDNTYTYLLNKDGSVTYKATDATTAADAYECLGNAEAAEEIAGINVSAAWKKGATVSYTYTVSTGAIAIDITNP